MFGTGELPEEVETRARRRRARLTATSIELLDLDDVDSVESFTDTVLIVGLLPTDPSERDRWLGRLRRRLSDDGQVWLIVASPAPASGSTARRVLSRVRPGSSSTDTRVVQAVRDAGWTVTAVDRFDVADGPSAGRWVDLVATTIR